MFDWVGDLIVGVGDTITGLILSLTESVATVIWDVMVGWIYTTIFGAIADFLSIMSGMGAEIFELEWIKAAVTLFCSESFRWNCTNSACRFKMCSRTILQRYSGGRVSA